MASASVSFAASRCAHLARDRAPSSNRVVAPRVSSRRRPRASSSPPPPRRRTTTLAAAADESASASSSAAPERPPSPPLPELCEPEDPADIYSELTFYDIEHDDEPDFYDDGEGWSIDGALSEEELAMLNASREDARADGSYFDSYGGVGIHREMIADETRTGAYLAAIEAHADELRGKVVLDVGCGTGILAMFAARAGARKVYAVEASGVAKHARRIVKDNGLDGVVEVIRGRMEDIGEDEIVEKVDCVLSEWMGYALLFESMLPSVIDARDRFMKPGGLVLPNVATIHVAALSDMKRYDDAVGFWDDVYGFDFSSLAARTRRDWSDDPPVSTVPRERVVSDAAEVARIDCATVRFEDLFEPTDGAFELVIEKPKKTSGGRGGTGEEEGVGQRGGEDAAEDEDAAAADADADDEDEEVMVNGLVLWFDVDFYGRASLSTSPMKPKTHWYQTILMFERPHALTRGDRIVGALSTAPGAKPGTKARPPSFLAPTGPRATASARRRAPFLEGSLSRRALPLSPPATPRFRSRRASLSARLSTPLRF